MASLLTPESLAMLIPIISLLIPIVVVVTFFNYKWRRDKLIHDTIRQLAERGQPIPPELLQEGWRRGSGFGPSTPGAGSHSSLAQRGVLMVAVGVGLMVMMWAMSPNSWLWSVGAIPFCMGVAHLVLWKLEAKPHV